MRSFRGQRAGGLRLHLIFLVFVSVTVVFVLIMSFALHYHVNAHSVHIPGNYMYISNEQNQTIFDAQGTRRPKESKSDQTRPDPGKTARLLKVAYVVSISSCGSTSLRDGAAVLQYSIRTTSTGAHGIDLLAIVHPDAEWCGRQLEVLGFQIIVRDIPVPVHEIQGEYLRSKIDQNGCCGAKELIKLEAYTLTDYQLVVHLDIDTMVLKPMDALFDFILGNAESPISSHDGLMWPDRPTPPYIEAAFTLDYNTVPPKRLHKPVQGGLLVVRPSMETYNDFCDLLREGDFRNGTGWGGVVKPSYGAMTIQGILPYYYDYLHNQEKSVELNRCIYNAMADNPRDKETKGETVQGKCRTGRKHCEDCRTRPVQDIVNFHFTCCQKPWWCLQLNHDNLNQRMCRQMTNIWHRIRFDLERSWGRVGLGNGTFDNEHFYGHCAARGKKGYLAMELPFPRIETNSKIGSPLSGNG